MLSFAVFFFLLEQILGPPRQCEIYRRTGGHCRALCTSASNQMV